MSLTGRVAVLGFGHQGGAHALNLRDAGIEVVVGAREGAGAERAREAGFDVQRLETAARGASTVAMMLADEALPVLWPALAAAIAPQATIVFAHGFNLLYGGLAIPPRIDVVLASPTAPGHVLRELVAAGDRVPGYLAVHQDASGRAWEHAEDYARALGLGPLWRTSVREETEVDLFGEQAVLCGGMQALIEAAFETLVAGGYAPEIAYLECVHQLKYLADLLHARGPAGMRRGISGTALFGDLTRGPRVIGPESRQELRAMLEEIRSGAFARAWAAEVEAGSPTLRRAIAAGETRPIEQARRRALGPLDEDSPGGGAAPRSGRDG